MTGSVRIGRLLLAGTALAGTALATGVPAFAQGVETPGAAAQADNDLGLRDIVVTAQKREETLQDTPISIAVLGGEDLETRGIASLTDFGSGTVPSLRIMPTTGRPSTLTVTMRGINPGDPFQISRDQTVGIYVDGIYLGRSQGLGGELFDLERIEVLRGPQGTLFGRNAVGGALSMITKRPTGELGLDLKAKYGRFNERSVEAHLNLPEFAGFSIKLDGVMGKRDGWVKNGYAGAKDWNAINRKGARASVKWQPSNDIEILYAFDISRDKSVAGYQQIAELLPGASPLPPMFSIESKRVRKGRVDIPLEPSTGKVSGHGLHASWDVTDNITLRSITAYRKMSQSQYDNSGGLLVPFYPNGVFARLSYGKVNQDQFSQELQVLGTFERFNFILGAFYFKEDARDIAYAPFTAMFNATGTDYTLLPVVLGGSRYPDRASDAHARSKAVFGQATYTPAILDDRLHLTAGLRWTYDRKHGTLSKLRGADIDIPFQFSSKRVDPAFTAAFDWTEAVNTYVRWGRAYRSGGANSRSSTYRPFGEEEVSTWEIGAKTELFDRRLRLNLAAYRTRYGDRQVDFINPSNPSNIETVNAPNSTTIKGLELDLTGRLTRQLTLTAGYAYTDWQASTDVNPFTGVIQNGAVIYTPKHSASLALDHEIPLGDFATLSSHIDAIYSGSFYTSGRTAPKTGSYAMLNGRITMGDIAIGAGDMRLAVSLWGKNLTDKAYETFQFSYSGAGLANTRLSNYNDPRTFGIEGRITF